MLAGYFVLGRIMLGPGFTTIYLIVRLLVISGFINIYPVRACATFRNYCSFAFSALASFRMGMSASASFQRARKSLLALRARVRAASASAEMFQ
jgi:hypothetical protein